MNLPNAEMALVESAKVRDYLLNPVHRFGGGKARFFESFGFTRAQHAVLVDALLQHARSNEVARVRQTGFGPRFEVEGKIVSPDRRNPRICTVWQLDEGDIAPRLITAYPIA